HRARDKPPNEHPRHRGRLRRLPRRQFLHRPNNSRQSAMDSRKQLPSTEFDRLRNSIRPTGLTQDDAIEATQFAIWRYTELTWDASWVWRSPASEEAYWHLIDGANNN